MRRAAQAGGWGAAEGEGGRVWHIGHYSVVLCTVRYLCQPLHVLLSLKVYALCVCVVQDITARETVRERPKCDRDVTIYGYLRGTNLKPGELPLCASGASPATPSRADRCRHKLLQAYIAALNPACTHFRRYRYLQAQTATLTAAGTDPSIQPVCCLYACCQRVLSVAKTYGLFCPT